MPANGQFPASALKRVPGSNAGLLKEAAYAYTAMHYASLKQGGVSLHIIDGAVGRTYRSYSRQLLAKRVYGSNAATPGFSNHGWALATDLMTTGQRGAIDRLGRFYGFSKACSDASWEWWHIKYNPACTGAGYKPQPKPDPLKPLGKRQRAACERLLYHRRERRQEGKSGKGPRWRKQDRWVRFWGRRVKRLHGRASGTRKAVLGRVLKDRDGYL